MKSSICKYLENCNVARISGRDCARNYKITCQTYKFYQRYGDEPLGIGACCDIGFINRLEKECQEDDLTFQSVEDRQRAKLENERR